MGTPSRETASEQRRRVEKPAGETDVGSNGATRPGGTLVLSLGQPGDQHYRKL
ncbi:hypothetical protein [Haloechinothrix salitolerans]|uniref:Uncharacterized protein n=1 Tax=Haloechinothrix salitolerans TaxID=926830 RepID=A0ABW2C728_9PSEU